METIDQKNTTEAFEKLLKGMTFVGKYDYLRVILTKSNKCKLGGHYLLVMRSGFGLVKLSNINFKDRIQMEFQDITTGMISKVCIDVEDHEFKFLLVDWDDIKGMVYEENKTDEKLLEFEF